VDNPQPGPAAYLAVGDSFYRCTSARISQAI